MTVVEFQGRWKKVQAAEQENRRSETNAVATVLLAVLNASGASYGDIATLMRQIDRRGGACDGDTIRLQRLLMIGRDRKIPPAGQQVAAGNPIQMQLALQQCPIERKRWRTDRKSSNCNSACHTLGGQR